MAGLTLEKISLHTNTFINSSCKEIPLIACVIRKSLSFFWDPVGCMPFTGYSPVGEVSLWSFMDMIYLIMNHEKKKFK